MSACFVCSSAPFWFYHVYMGFWIFGVWKLEVTKPITLISNKLNDDKNDIKQRVLLILQYHCTTESLVSNLRSLIFLGRYFHLRPKHEPKAKQG
jgi:hypothetical protein